MGAISSINQFIPNLVVRCTPLRPPLRRDTEWKWKQEYGESFRQIKEAINEMTEIKHFKTDPFLMILRNASKIGGLEAMFQANQEGSWETTNYSPEHFKQSLNKSNH